MTEKRMSRWYFGGIASCGAACCTHPLDLIKVHLQTQQEVKLRMVGMATHVVKSEGFLALYSGLSASLCRQMSYSLTRFAIYETVRDVIGSTSQGPMPFYQKVLLGAFGGRERTYLSPSYCRHYFLLSFAFGSYKHAIDGLVRVFQEEGLRKLFSGATMASSRGALVTVGQLACYDQAKQLVLGTGVMGDNVLTHFLSSFIAGGCATFLCQPLDVMKTRLMSSKGEYTGVTHCLRETARLGPMAFYKGLVPAGIRLIPHTVLTFMFLEQLKNHFGIRIIS
uniref:Solute carrier family 25 member 10b n=1 Tax=Gadus morhua TaxID=8049 RepID=A0A8C5AP08_GADMO